MKTGKYYLGLTIIIGILCGSVLGEVELPPAESEHLLIAQPNPNLKGIRQLYIIVRSPTNVSPVSYGITFEELENSVKEKIEEAGIAIAEGDVNKLEPNSTEARLAKRIDPNNVKHLKFIYAHAPELRIKVDSFDIKDSNKVVFYVQTSLARLAYLGRDSRPGFKMDVWQSEPIMRAVSAEGMPAAVTGAVLEQVEAFIYAYHAANPQYNRPSSDANDVNKDSKELAEPAAESTPASQQNEPAEHKYVASKNGTVFHKPECSSARRIKPENLVYYNSRDGAISAGKRPCKQCNP